MNILIINGHPYEKSFCRSLALAYQEGANEKKHDVKLLNLGDLKFNLNLSFGYKQIQELEPDLINAQQLIKSAEHIVIITPIWWGGPPALLKGFIDRTFLPGFAFKYRSTSKMWDKFLTNKTGRLIVTSDAPTWWMRWLRGDSTVKMIQQATLDFVGVRPVKVSRFGDIKWLNELQRNKILKEVKQLGIRGI